MKLRDSSICGSSLLCNLFFLLVLLPYASPMPIHTDVQPTAFVMGAIIILYAIATGRRMPLDVTDLTFLLFALFSLAYINPWMGDLDFFAYRKGIGLLLAFIVFYVAKYSVSQFSSLTLTIACFCYVAVGAIQLVLPQFFEILVPGRLIVETRSALYYGRGITSLCPESGFLGFASLFLILMLAPFTDRGRSVPTLRKYFVIASAGILLLASKSGTGYVAGCLMLLVYLLQRHGVLRLLKVVPFCLVGLALIYWVGVGRGRALLDAFLWHPERIFADWSIMLRLVQILIGFLSLVEYPLGNGDVWFTSTALDIIEKYNLLAIVEGDGARDYVMRQMSSGGVSVMATYSVRLGLFIYLFLAFVLWRSRYGLNYFLYVTFFLLAFIASIPILYPPVWFILGWTAGLRKQAIRNRSILQARSGLHAPDSDILSKQDPVQARPMAP